MEWQAWKDIAALGESVTTICAILIGGYWTYRTFIRERLGFTKLNVKIHVDEFSLGTDGRVIHTQIEIINSGKTKFVGSAAQLRMRQVIPAPETIHVMTRSNTNIVSADRTEVEWPCLTQRDWEWKEGVFEIEPGETDNLHADFGVRRDVEVVQFYFYIENWQKKKQNIGWSATQICRIGDTGVLIEKRKDRNGLTEQERQQKQQRPQPGQQQQQKPLQDPAKKPK